jgi:hypothetical protein
VTRNIRSGVRRKPVFSVWPKKAELRASPTPPIDSLAPRAVEQRILDNTPSLKQLYDFLEGAPERDRQYGAIKQGPRRD